MERITGKKCWSIKDKDDAKARRKPYPITVDEMTFNMAHMEQESNIGEVAQASTKPPEGVAVFKVFTVPFSIGKLATLRENLLQELEKTESVAVELLVFLNPRGVNLQSPL